MSVNVKVTGGLNRLVCILFITHEPQTKTHRSDSWPAASGRVSINRKYNHVGLNNETVLLCVHLTLLEAISLTECLVCSVSSWSRHQSSSSRVSMASFW